MMMTFIIVHMAKLRKNPAYTHELKKQIENKLKFEKITRESDDTF